jgi:hypothetical protein
LAADRITTPPCLQPCKIPSPSPTHWSTHLPCPPAQHPTRWQLYQTGSMCSSQCRMRRECISWQFPVLHLSLNTSPLTFIQTTPLPSFQACTLAYATLHLLFHFTSHSTGRDAMPNRVAGLKQHEQGGQLTPSCLVLWNPTTPHRPRWFPSPTPHPLPGKHNTLCWHHPAPTAPKHLPCSAAHQCVLE